MMADQQTPQTPQTFWGSIMSFNPKIVLAFFLVIIAAAMVIYLINTLVSTTAKLDPGTIALFASMVTTFILMAKSATDYQTSSSAGSDKKDDAQTAVSKALAEKVPAPAPIAPPPVPPAVVVAWWGALDAAEQQALQTAASTDPKVQAFIDAAKSGRATADDLAYLVSKIPPLLSQQRADAIKAI